MINKFTIDVNKNNVMCIVELKWMIYIQTMEVIAYTYSLPYRKNVLI